MFSRRRFLVLFPAFAASARASAAWPTRKKKFVPPRSGLRLFRNRHGQRASAKASINRPSTPRKVS